MREKTADRAGQWTSLKTVLQVLLRYARSGILLDLLLSLAVSLSFLLSSFCLKNLTDSLFQAVHTGGGLTMAFYGYLSAYLLLFFLNGSSSFIRTFASNAFTFSAKKVLHSLFMMRCMLSSEEKMLERSWLEEKKYVGDRIEEICNYLEQFLSQTASSVFELVMCMVIFLQAEPFLALYIPILFGSGFLVNRNTSRKALALQKRQSADSRVSDFYFSILTSRKYAAELRASCLRESMLGRWKDKLLPLLREKEEVNASRQSIFNRFFLFRMLLKLGIYLILALGLIYHHYTPGTFLLLFSLSGKLDSGIWDFSANLAGGIFLYNPNIISFSRFVFPMDRKTIDEAVHPGKKDNRSSGRQVNAPFSSLELDTVSYTYPNGVQALHNISLHIKRGEIICILGENGSGKTTLSKIISGSYAPASGRILWNGKEIRPGELPPMGYVPQEIPHFSLTLQEYLALGNLKEKDNTTRQDAVLRTVGLKDAADGFPKREKQLLGKEYDEEGTELSIGQWQRLCIAQGLFSGRSIIILDEPTASVDPLEELRFLEDISRMAHQNNTSVLFITHRIAFARHADQILLLDHGKLAESGTHEELMELHGIYSELFLLQQALYSR